MDALKVGHQTVFRKLLNWLKTAQASTSKLGISRWYFCAIVVGISVLPL